jgi:hypothetical protein
LTFTAPASCPELIYAAAAARFRVVVENPLSLAKDGLEFAENG